MEGLAELHRDGSVFGGFIAIRLPCLLSIYYVERVAQWLDGLGEVPEPNPIACLWKFVLFNPFYRELSLIHPHIDPGRPSQSLD